MKNVHLQLIRELSKLGSRLQSADLSDSCVTQQTMVLKLSNRYSSERRSFFTFENLLDLIR
ncbi:hypothetical protein PMAYCL1PPCAC_25577 [Pristionchus mayeri]|uniref:Uncharacterized protein n=1 Tax=Pristionchus mayeri TaxID=1317129 RepID=A0AAN5D3F7_9BILA|nr:hypothetical protein PMAYCL1PPCAC_25577 [Pristionchus mayeri]